MAKTVKQRGRRAKDRAGIPQDQRHLGRRLNGEGCMPKEGDFAITSSASRRPKGPSQPLKPVGPWANVR
uniref:OSJNBa0032N05.3 protein n=2 Tax=Oryza sativa subsp. japonica TaxID=39947 RepID=Q7X6G5_ORYSJ|nr:OSJNBa0022F16.28 [Oryza sativa Japonica Group]CAE05575.3 OSJNBa0032N05.3 [Oryza sativa Japonica Group]